MQDKHIPLPEVHTIYAQLRGRKGQYFLTNGGCLFLEEEILDLDREKDFLFQVPSDMILITQTFRLIYRVGHYPVLLGTEREILDIPVEPVHHPIILHPRMYEWGVGNCELFDLDSMLRVCPPLGNLLVRRTGESSGAF